jgi:hypothetical protein
MNHISRGACQLRGGRGSYDSGEGSGEIFRQISIQFMRPPIRSEKGIALVATLCLTLILFVFAIALAHRMAAFLRMFATAKEKNQTYYTAVTGIEQLRDRLRNGACRPPDWCGLLGTTGSPAVPDYRDVTFFATLKSPPAIFPDTPEAGDTETRYTIFLKDNDEFDNNYNIDGDELVIAVVTSFGQNETRTSIETGLLFDAEAASPYKQFGQGSGRKNSAYETGDIAMQVRP